VIHHIKASEYTEAPWKNGGGLTYEVAADDFQPPSWRVSVARIDRSGPFSDFTGYDRTIVALDGAPVVLNIEGTTIPLEVLVPFSFRGEASVEASIAGSARDLNVMTQRVEWVHDVEVVSGAARFVLDEDEFALVFAAGSVSVEGERLDSGDTAAIEECESFGVIPDEGAHACVIRITQA